MLFKRMELLLEGKVPAATLFSGPYDFAEPLRFRKIIDATSMIATMITGEADPADLQKYFAALRRARRDIDLRPERYTHDDKREFPVRYRARMDTRRWGLGERLVSEPCTPEAFETWCCRASSSLRWSVSIARASAAATAENSIIVHSPL